jgi:hypothetical protein
LYKALGFVETNRYWDNPIDRTIYLGKTLGAVGSNASNREE